MTDTLVHLALLSLLAGLVAYRITRLVTEDSILADWRKRHGIAQDGFRCGDAWYADWPEGVQGCVSEMSSEQPYRDAVQQSGRWPWPIRWVAVLCTSAFWKRAFSCGQCGSVWVAGALALVAVILMAASTGQWTWLAAWLVVTPAAAAIASWML